MASLRGGGTVSVNCTTLHDSSPHLLLSGFSPEVWRMWQHSSIRVSRLSPVHSRRCAAMSLWWRRRWQREGTLTEPGQAYTFAPSSLLPPPSLLYTLLSLLFPLSHPSSLPSALSPPLTKISSQPPPLLHGCVYISPSRASTLPPGCGPWTLAPTAAGSQSIPAGVVVWGSEVWWCGGVGQ